MICIKIIAVAEDIKLILIAHDAQEAKSTRLKGVKEVSLGHRWKGERYSQVNQIENQ